MQQTSGHGVQADGHPEQAAIMRPRMAATEPPKDPRIMAAEADLVERVRRTFKEKTLVVRNTPDAEKMSEVLIQFAKPLLKEDDDLEQHRKAYLLATLAWNLAILPEAQRREDLERGELAKTFGPEGIALMRALIERKLLLFPHNTRPILDLSVTDLGDSLHVDVISGLQLPHEPVPRKAQRINA